MGDLNEKQLRRLQASEAVFAGRGLARLTSTELQLFASHFASVESSFLERHRERLAPFRLAVLGSYTTHHLVRVLRLFLYEMGLAPEVYEAEFDSIQTELLDSASEVFTFRPEAMLLLTGPDDIKAFPDLFADREAVLIWADNQAKQYQTIWERAKSISGCQVVHSLTAVPARRQLGNLETYHAASRTRSLRLLEMELVSRRPPHVLLFDMDYLASRFGKDRWFDEVNFYISKQGMSFEAMGLVAHALSRVLAAYKGKVRKCLVLDLDNTLWGGVIGDDGVGGIVLGNNDPVGEAYMAFQDYVKSLQRRGVILAVCSKNEDAAARAPFRTHGEMRLRENDIACFVANWDDKATNLRRIAAELNIGTDSLVFFDDNPVEREIIRRFLPEVEVIDVPDDPALYIRALDDAMCFEWTSLSAEDATRSASYVADNSRRELEAEAVDYPGYLDSLEMGATVGGVGSMELTRFVQLINKSNQFNLRTRRYSDAAVDALRGDLANWAPIFVALHDRFTNYGIISCVVLERRGDQAFIDTWVMSCRVLKRGVEDVALNALVAATRAWGCRWLVGEHIPTEKNMMVKDLLPSVGFERCEPDFARPSAPGGVVYRLDIDCALLRSHHISLEAPAAQ